MNDIILYAILIVGCVGNLFAVARLASHAGNLFLTIVCSVAFIMGLITLGPVWERLVS